MIQTFGFSFVGYEDKYVEVVGGLNPNGSNSSFLELLTRFRKLFYALKEA